MFMSSCRRKLRSGASVQRSTCTGKSNHGGRVAAFYKMADFGPFFITNIHTLTDIPGRGSRHSSWRTCCHVALPNKSSVYSFESLNLLFNLLKMFGNVVCSLKNKMGPNLKNKKGCVMLR